MLCYLVFIFLFELYFSVFFFQCFLSLTYHSEIKEATLFFSLLRKPSFNFWLSSIHIEYFARFSRWKIYRPRIRWWRIRWWRWWGVVSKFVSFTPSVSVWYCIYLTMMFTRFKVKYCIKLVWKLSVSSCEYRLTNLSVFKVNSALYWWHN